VQGDRIRTIVARTIKHDDQRYDTCGDWLVDGTNLTVLASETGDWRESFLVTVHEIVEAGICVRLGIQEPDVCRFDTKYEAARGDDDTSEPGDSLDAPYYHAHQIATQVERIVAHALGVHWPTYEADIIALDYRKAPPPHVA
jgi:hypothetical protein